MLVIPLVGKDFLADIILLRKFSMTDVLRNVIPLGILKRKAISVRLPSLSRQSSTREDTETECDP